jgi:Stress responsive A/B Barrel Domain
MAMPSHISGIQGWALSRVWPAEEEGRAWTHVWEQEFPDVTAFEIDYMLHPYQWTGVDRWFDQEVPGAIVDPEFANALYEIADPVLTGQPALDVTVPAL